MGHHARSAYRDIAVDEAASMKEPKAKARLIILIWIMLALVLYLWFLVIAGMAGYGHGVALERQYTVSLLGGSPEEIVKIELVSPRYGNDAGFQAYSFSQQQVSEFRDLLKVADKARAPDHAIPAYEVEMRLWFRTSGYGRNRGDVLAAIYKKESNEDDLFLQRVIAKRWPHRSRASTRAHLERARLLGAGAWMMDILRQAGKACQGTTTLPGRACDTRGT